MRGDCITLATHQPLCIYHPSIALCHTLQRISQLVHLQRRPQRLIATLQGPRAIHSWRQEELLLLLLLLLLHWAVAILPHSMGRQCLRRARSTGWSVESMYVQHIDGSGVVLSTIHAAAGLHAVATPLGVQHLAATPLGVQH